MLESGDCQQWLLSSKASYYIIICRQTELTEPIHQMWRPDTLQCLCCLSAVCSYTIQTLTSRQYTYTYRHETWRINSLSFHFITGSLKLYCSSFSASISMSFSLSHFAPNDPANIYQPNIQDLGSVYPLNGFLHLRHAFHTFHKNSSQTCEIILTLPSCVRH